MGPDAGLVRVACCALYGHFDWLFASASAQKDELHCLGEQFCNILKPLCRKRTPQKRGASRIIANQNQMLTEA